MTKSIQRYHDPLKVFLEISLNQIDYFKTLSPQIKNEWIFNMQLKQFSPGQCLYKLDTQSEEMYVVQSGLVEVVHKMGND